MKKSIIISIVILLIGGGIIWWYFSRKNNEIGTVDNENSYQQEVAKSENNGINNKEKNQNEKKEEEISSFSTKIKNKDKERQNNIQITCESINGTEIKPGEVFSFCNTVGKATTQKGYQKADIYVDGKKKQGLGGGNCQVSTTIYNAVLNIPELEIVERHKHSGHVTYIQDGKDAAVSYGSYDFKFKNNTQNTIKIVMEKTPDDVSAKLIRIV